MPIKHHQLFLFTIIGLFSTPTFANFLDPIDGQFDMGDYLANNAYGFMPIPILITEPAVGVGGGFLGMFLHESEKDKQDRKAHALSSPDGGAQLLAPAITVAGGAVTDNGTWMALVAHRHTWNDDSIRYLGGMGYGHANIDVFRRAPENWPIDASLKMSTASEGFLLKQHVEFRLPNTQLFLGVSQSVSTFSTSINSASVDLSGHIIDIPNISPSLQSTVSSLGVIAELDTRNNLFFPTKGASIVAEYMIYDEALGSDYNYHTLDVDAFKYVPVNDSLTLGFAGSYSSLKTEEAFLPPLSNPYINMRGVAAYKYQGNEVSTLQAQAMWHMTSRWTLTGFYGVGSAAEESEALYESTVSAYGAGFRYNIARRYGLNVGMDYAISEGEGTLYFQVGTGF
ncbi:BamA/TamA family outer membrane protein [Vibrio sp. 10N.222.51.C12]|uniref:BamA/TamA family outer membrane protein n=1 Tax=unclassified Vibrio TaxID=2614977 RepID=UPI000C858C63|nr:BamA/TamA family outer membrane protein [Vibrio sp. 10N.286.48.B7]